MMNERVPSVASEDLASFLQDIPAGAHVAAVLRELAFGHALEVSRDAASDRGERLIVIGHTASDGTPPFATSLLEALERLRGVDHDALSGTAGLFVVVDAAASIEAAGAGEHVHAERNLSPHLARRLTVVCLYTEDASRAVSPEASISELHSLVAVPGSLSPYG